MSPSHPAEATRTRDDAPEAALAETRLRLLLEIDTLRDTAEDPDSLLSSMARVMAKVFDADICLLFMTDEVSGQPELRAEESRDHSLPQLSPGVISSLAWQTAAIDGVRVLQGPEAQSLMPNNQEGLHIVVVPIIIGGDDRMGTLLLARSGAQFSSSEIDLLYFAESQLDSSLVQARRLYDLDLRNRELETIYEVDRIRDARLCFDEMLKRVLAELRRVIPSELAFIMLHDRPGTRLELRGISPGWPVGDDLLPTLTTAAQEAVAQKELVLFEEPDRGPGTVVCAPLILREKVLGVLGLYAKGPHAFGGAARRLLRAISSQMDTAVFESLEQGRLRNVLERTVGSQIMERLLETCDVGILEGERRHLTVLYGDLRGSTRLAETANPRDLVEFLNDYLGEMAEVILKSDGTLDKFMGDEVMALFGAPLPMDDHAQRAVQVGLEMQRVHGLLMQRWLGRGIDPPPLGVGIATGEMIVGELGSGRRSDYTVLGAPANLGARIQGFATGGQVLVSEETHRLLNGRVRSTAIPGLQFKGIREAVTIFEVSRL